jgi:ribosome-binding ATPase
MIERRIDRTKKAMKGDKKFENELALLERLKEALDNGTPARAVERTDSEAELISTMALLTEKPVIYAANMSENDFKNGYENNPHYKKLIDEAKKEGAEVLPICAKIEEDLSGMPDDEKSVFLEDLGLAESGLDRLIRASYSLLGLISYLTAGAPEVRAWTIKKGTKAPQAAGKIHSDFERGFIRAEVVAYKDLMDCGSMAAAKEKGLIRSEGKDYVMQDGDIVLFRFNV